MFVDTIHDKNKMTANKQVNFLIDCTAATNRISGIERYVRELAPRIAELLLKRGQKITIALSEGANWWPNRLSQINKINVVYLASSNRIIRDQIQVPMLARKVGANVAWFPALPPSPFFFLANPNCLVLRTVHDAVMWNQKNTMSKGNRFYYRPMENFWLPRYYRVHTVSHFSKSELVDIFPYLENKLIVSGNGVSNISDQKSEPISPLDKTWLDRLGNHPILLFVGTIEPRKNIPFLLQVFSDVLRNAPDVRLVLAGRAGWGNEEVQHALNTLKLRDAVISTGAVDDAMLSWLYKRADIFLFPSLSEGFGLPVVEAMSAGLPVISSDAGALPEAAGDAAILLSPNDKDAWVSSILSLLTPSRERLLMTERGFVQAASFSWDAVAERIAATL